MRKVNRKWAAWNHETKLFYLCTCQQTSQICSWTRQRVCVGTVAVKRQIWWMWGDERGCWADSQPESDSTTPAGASSHHQISVCMRACFTPSVLTVVWLCTPVNVCCTCVCLCVCLWAQGGCMQRVAWRGEREDCCDEFKKSWQEMPA